MEGDDREKKLERKNVEKYRKLYRETMKKSLSISDRMKF